MVFFPHESSPVPTQDTRPLNASLANKQLSFPSVSFNFFNTMEKAESTVGNDSSKDEQPALIIDIAAEKRLVRKLDVG